MRVQKRLGLPPSPEASQPVARFGADGHVPVAERVDMLRRMTAVAPVGDIDGQGAERSAHREGEHDRHRSVMATQGRDRQEWWLSSRSPEQAQAAARA
jgi:hypothetical protein